MSWNNALPWWIYDLQHEHFLASSTCAFAEEWFSGTSRVMPNHVIKTSTATFAAWDEGGWHHDCDD